MMVSTRVALSAAILLVVGFLSLLLIVGMTFLLGRQTEGDLDQAALASQTSAAAVALFSAVQTCESSQRGYIASGNQIFLGPYPTATAEAKRQMANLAQLMRPDAASAPKIARLSEILDEKLAEMDQTIELKRTGKDAEAVSSFRTGKSLMDEARVFISSITRTNDQKLTLAIDAQKKNLSFLRLANLAAAAVILVVVGGVFWLNSTFLFRLDRANAEVAALNSDLERRVDDRTAALNAALGRAESLLVEVNHRVANSLSLVASMVGLQLRSSKSEEVKKILNDTQSRIYAVAMVHKKLYSSGDIHSVELSEFLSSLLEQLELSLRGAGHTSAVVHDLAPVKLPTDQSVSVGVIAAEWVTNAFKYAYPQGAGEIRVVLKQDDDGSVHLVVEDDGVGRNEAVAPKGTGLGTKLVNSMASSLGATVNYTARHPGTAAQMVIPAA